VNGELDPEDLEGAVIEAGPAAVKKTMPTRGRRKAAKPSSRNPEPLNQSQASPSVLQPPTPSDDDLEKADASLLYTVFTSTSPSSNWDEQKAKEILNDCRTKLLAEGLLVPSSTTPPAPQIDTEGEGTSDAELDGEPNGGGPARGPAKKKRGKKGGRR